MNEQYSVPNAVFIDLRSFEMILVAEILLFVLVVIM